jgi:acyl homoserine lactone synthase
MQTTALSFENIHQHGLLFSNLFRERHTTFIETMGWELRSHKGMEFDQYDTAQATWLAIQKERRLVAGARLLPSTASCGIYSYMIRDAQKGFLPCIPEDLLYEPAPVCPTVWELTRCHIFKDVSADLRPELLEFFAHTVTTEAAACGAKLLMALTTITLQRWVRRAGYDIIEMGPVMTMGRPHQVMAFRL